MRRYLVLSGQIIIFICEYGTTPNRMTAGRWRYSGVYFTVSGLSHGNISVNSRDWVVKTACVLVKTASALVKTKAASMTV